MRGARKYMGPRVEHEENLRGGGKLEEGGGKLGGQMKATAFTCKLITLLRVFPGLDPGI